MVIPVPPSECASAREAVSRRLDGELSELDSARLDVHLRRCSSCREFAGQAAAIVVRLRRAPLEKPTVTAFQPRWRRPGSLSRLQAAAAVLAVVAAGSSFALGRLVADRSSNRATPAPLTAPDVARTEIDAAQHHLLALLPPTDLMQARRTGRPMPI